MAYIRTLFRLALCILPLSVCAGNAGKCHRLYDKGQYRQAMTCYMQPDIISDPAIMNRIGIMYGYGQGVPPNPDETYKWFRRSADAGFAPAQTNLGLMYAQGNGIPQDFTEAAHWFLLAAKQNDPDAEKIMAYYYVTGTGVPRDYREAMKWYRRAAGHGDTTAYADIGLLYAKGNGVARDPNRAVQYYIMGAMAGDPHAQALLAVQYLTGEGITKDTRRAARWFEKAARNGYLPAIKKMVKIYTYGQPGYDRNPEKAEYWRNLYNRKLAEQRKTGSRVAEPPLPSSTD